MTQNAWKSGQDISMLHKAEESSEEALTQQRLRTLLDFLLGVGL